MTGQQTNPRAGLSAGATAETTSERLNRLMRGAMPFAVLSLAVLAVLYTFYFASELFLPIFFAAFLSIILRPVVYSLKYIGLPEALGATAVLGGLVGAIAVGAATLTPPVEEWVERLPEIHREIEAKLWPVKQSIEKAKEATEKIGNIADADKNPSANQMEIEGRSLLDRVFATTWLSLIQILITLALTFLFLARRTDRARATFRKLPWPQFHDAIEEVAQASRKTIARFLRVSAVIYIALGLLTTGAMFLLGMPYPVLWGILAAIFGFMPYVGPLVVFGCIGAVSLLTFDDVWRMLAPPLVYGILTVVEGYFVTPTILGRHLTLSPIAIFLSMLLWTWIWGMPGALLSVPILVVATVAARHVMSVVEERRMTGRSESPAGAVAVDPAGG